MNRKRIALVALPALLAVMGTGTILPGTPPGNQVSNQPVQSFRFYQPAPMASVSIVAATDTVRAGDVYITQLPDSLEGRPVESYTAERLPLRSWLLDKSFFWSTTEADRGEHAFTFLAHDASSMGDPADSVDVEPVSWTLILTVH